MAIIVGQEAITPDGLGRVVSFVKELCPTPIRNYAKIKVRLYHNEQVHEYKEHEVELIDPRK